MSCKEIIIAKLKELGADGLCREECGCGLDDLFPCDECQFDCEPAKKIKDPGSHDGIEIFIPLNEKSR